ncbi:hypothetical protein EX30DRAFT_344767 [Ascodesmis nigricans]|uniref:Uncharacterized protein n=1 Tax=Ascodesmis nigricans TaxID=341454 RepID=A0A4S2MQ12_9PEZI|nr:hypothetical protein EX30DRAFT_344767 [Ascodesmis nigricans]
MFVLPVVAAVRVSFGSFILALNIVTTIPSQSSSPSWFEFRKYAQWRYPLDGRNNFPKR